MRLELTDANGKRMFLVCVSICDERTGFKKGSRKSDHILSLKTLIDKTFKKSKYLYCCFIDLRKAFEVVNRTALFAELSKYNIQGIFIQVLKKMYKEVYYSVKLLNGSLTKFIPVLFSNKVSYTLFSLYINGLVENFDSTSYPVELQHRKLSCLLCADDTVLFSESANGPQNFVGKLEYFCKKWNLTVNLNKTYVLTEAGRVAENLKFHYDSENIANAGECKY